MNGSREVRKKTAKERALFDEMVLTLEKYANGILDLIKENARLRNR
jgi:hypothetical protein